jgi:hypothetical protein
VLTVVIDLNTGEFAEYTLGPFQAVIAAYAQRERRDWSTWDYSTKYGHLVKVADSAKPGWEVITCGNQSTLRDKSVGAHGWPLRMGADGERHLVCPKCGKSDITMGAQWPVRGTGPMGRGRMGDVGASEVITCNACGHSERKAL